MKNNVTGRSTKQSNNGKPKGMAGGTATKKSAMPKAQQQSGDYASGPGVATTPFRGVPPHTRGRGSSHDGPGAPGNVHTGTHPALKVGKGSKGGAC